MESSVPIEANRSFKGMVRKENAVIAARAAAVHLALQRGAKQLADHPDVVFLLSDEQDGLKYEDLLPLAALVFTASEQEIIVEGFPPEMCVVVRVAVQQKQNFPHLLRCFVGSKQLRQYLLASVMLVQESLREYDKNAQILLSINSVQDSRYAQEQEALQTSSTLLQGIFAYIDLLGQYDAGWLQPDNAAMQLGALVNSSPQNYLMAASLAEAMLQLDRSAEAIELADAAILLRPTWAKSHDVKGLALVRNFLPALAVRSFSSAIDCDPAEAEYLLHRGFAYFILKEHASMCEDFSSACRLGVCEQYTWARENSLCAQ